MSDVREASLEPSTDKLPGAALQAGPFVLLAACAVWVVARWDELPARIPVHWNVHGQVDRVVSRTPLGVALPLFIGAATCLLLLVSQYGLKRAAPRHRARAATIKILLGAEYVSAIASTSALVASLTSGRMLAPMIALPVAGVVALLVASILAMRNAPRGGARNPSSWRGPFYADRDDPALFVPKRYGWGYTINMAHPFGMLLLVAVLAIPVLALIFAFTAR